MEPLLELLIWLLLGALAWLLECYEALRAAIEGAMVAMFAEAGGFAQLGEELCRAIMSFLIVGTVVAVAIVAAILLTLRGRARAVAVAQ